MAKLVAFEGSSSKKVLKALTFSVISATLSAAATDTELKALADAEDTLSSDALPSVKTATALFTDAESYNRLPIIPEIIY